MPMPKDEADMRGEGWRKELTIKKIVVKRGIITCQEWDFYAERMPCRIREGGITGPICGTDHAWVKGFHGKLFWGCARHRCCNGPISFEVGVKAEEYNVGALKAIKICDDYGQRTPREVIRAVAQEKAIESGRRRPDPNK